MPRTGAVAHLLEFVGMLPASDEGFLVKRLIGLPGDRVVCCDSRGRVSVNGVPLRESDYLFEGNEPSLQELDVVVPRDALWMMGDHRADSGDSRPHLGDGTASVPRANVVGRAFVTVWPVDQAHRLERPGTFDAVLEPDVPAPSGAVVHTPAFVRAGDR